MYNFTIANPSIRFANGYTNHLPPPLIKKNNKSTSISYFKYHIISQHVTFYMKSFKNNSLTLIEICITCDFGLYPKCCFLPFHLHSSIAVGKSHKNFINHSLIRSSSVEFYNISW